MKAHEYYKKETGKLYYKEAALELELSDDYINWLERNVVKLFAILAVEERSEQIYCTCSRAKGLDHDEEGTPYCISCQKEVQ